MKSIIDLIGDYQKYLTYINGNPIFNMNTFLTNKNQKDRAFFTNFKSTLNFQQFIGENCKEEFPYFYKLLIRFNAQPLKKKKSDNPIVSFFKRSSSTTIKTVKENSDLNKSGSNKKLANHNITIINSSMKGSANNENSNSGSKGSGGPGAVEGKSDLPEGFIILPYFIEEEIIKSDYNKLEVHLREKFKGKFKLTLDCIPKRFLSNFLNKLNFEVYEKEEVKCLKYVFIQERKTRAMSIESPTFNSGFNICSNSEIVYDKKSISSTIFDCNSSLAHGKNPLYYLFKFLLKRYFEA